MTSLAPYASIDTNSRGRRFKEPSPNNRTEFQRDRDRIVHSAAFRRLEYKTQVFVNHEGDMFRTRLTHSIEVAQIARTVARELNVNEDLTEAISLAHDLGHTPFGHAGQDRLNKCMHEFGGFEHNLQSLRIVDELEEKYADFNGLNLTFESREGILKHCSQHNAKRLGDVGERFLTNQQPGIEAQISNIADQIAYNNHDVDDGLRAGLLTIEQLSKIELFQTQHQLVMEQYQQITPRRAIHEIIRRMINCQITDLLHNSQKSIMDVTPTSRQDISCRSKPVLGFSHTMQQQTNALKIFLRSELYQHYRVHRMSTKADNIIQRLFDAFMDDPRLLPPEPKMKTRQLEHQSGTNGQARAIADYIAGMTDRYAIGEYERIFNPAH